MSQEQAIASIKDFFSALGEILEENSTTNRTLEEYLRSLWALLQKHQDETLTWQLMAQLLKEAFTESPAPFDEAWLVYTKPVEMYPPIPSDIKINEMGLQQQMQFLREDYAVAKEMVLYQIADLHRMKEVGTLNLLSNTLYFGVKSPTNQSWYNFDSASFLECANRACIDHRWTKEDSKCSWGFLAVFLYLGQIYE